MKLALQLYTVYMTSYFIGGSLGTFLGTIAWKHYDWIGICTVGISFTLLAFVVHVIFKSKMKQES